MPDSARHTADEAETLCYRVPDHQDPTVVLTALSDADYRAGLEEFCGHMYVIVICLQSRDRDREGIREAIAHQADKTSLEGPALHAKGRLRRRGVTARSESISPLRR